RGRPVDAELPGQPGGDPPAGGRWPAAARRQPPEHRAHRAPAPGAQLADPFVAPGVRHPGELIAPPLRHRARGRELTARAGDHRLRRRAVLDPADILERIRNHAWCAFLISRMKRLSLRRLSRSVSFCRWSKFSYPRRIAFSSASMAESSWLRSEWLQA